MRVYVGNLSYHTREEYLETAFAAFGTVRSVSIIRGRQTGESRGFAFVEMDDEEEASSAVIVTPHAAAECGVHERNCACSVPRVLTSGPGCPSCLTAPSLSRF